MTPEEFTEYVALHDPKYVTEKTAESLIKQAKKVLQPEVVELKGGTVTANTFSTAC